MEAPSTRNRNSLLAVHYDLQGIVHMFGVGGATAQIQKMTGPEIATVFGNLFSIGNNKEKVKY